MIAGAYSRSLYKRIILRNWLSMFSFHFNMFLQVLRLLSSGSFYYAMDNGSGRRTDLTVGSQKCAKGADGDDRFFWFVLLWIYLYSFEISFFPRDLWQRILCFRNKHLHFPLKRYKINPDEWLLRLICGAVVICQVYVGQQRATVALISRLSCERAGTRFNVRGVDDDGHVANFVETEQVSSFSRCTFSVESENCEICATKRCNYFAHLFCESNWFSDYNTGYQRSIFYSN